jgi:fumarate reductase subunit D
MNTALKLSDICKLYFLLVLLVKFWRSAHRITKSLPLFYNCNVLSQNEYKFINDTLSNFYGTVSLATGLGYTSLNITDRGHRICG